MYFSHFGTWMWQTIRWIQGVALGFLKDECSLRASALTYYSLLSIVPVVAVLFGIAKGFGFEEALRQDISIRLADQRELLEKIMEFANAWLLNAQGGVIAGVGTAMLLWTAIGLFNNVESALNAIWKSETTRSYRRKIGDYLAALVIIPFLLVGSSSLSVYLNTYLNAASPPPILSALGPLFLTMLRLFPFFLTIGLFSWTYRYMPDAFVSWKAASIGGSLAGVMFLLWQWAYIYFQIGVSSYGAIYGSFAALPLFFVWLQLSWVIFLAGAEMAFHIDTSLSSSSYHQTIPLKTAALLLCYQCIDAFQQGFPPSTVSELTKECGISLSDTKKILHSLSSAKILAPIPLKNGDIGYQPARSIPTITTKRILEAVDSPALLPYRGDSSSLMDLANHKIHTLADLLETSPFNTPIYPS